MRAAALTGSLLASLALLSSPVSAQEFPARTVSLVSPYQAGGTSDIIARSLAQKLSEIWGKSVIVENRPGANGGIGVTAVTHAAPDGHTLLTVASSALTLNPTFYSNLPYNVATDLAPITRTGVVANVLVVNPSVPAKTVQELIALAKKEPGKLSYASQGVGSNGQVTGELFKQRTGVDLLHVPYKGSAPAVQDLLSGNVQVMFDNLPSVLSLVRAGKLRALAVTTAQRAPQLPDVPTLAGSGLANFDTSAWFAVLAPAKTPPELRARIEKAIVTALTDADTRKKLSDAGVEIAADGAAVLQQRITDETAMWRDVITKAGIQVK